MGTDIVIALQHSKADQRGGYADGCETGMARRRIRPAMVHGRRNRHAGGHFVVQQSTNPLTQLGSKQIIETVIAAGGIGVDAARQVPFKMLEDLADFVNVFRHNQERCIAEGLGLQSFRIGQELLA